MTQNDTEYMTPEEAAARLGVSHQTLYRYVKDRRIPRYRQGPKRVLFKRADVEKLLQVRLEEQQGGKD